MSETQISARLRAFVDAAPVAREPHLAFLSQVAQTLEPGSRVLDVGAGEAPYRELFEGLEYVTCDWSDTQYRPDIPPDIVAPAHAIPVSDDSFDAIVSTQALEHMPEPWTVLEEFARVVRPGGHLWLTTPLTWYAHEIPHDYYRYTSFGLSHLLGRAGFVDVVVKPMNNSLATLAELLRQTSYMIGRADDGYDDQRNVVGELLRRLAPVVEAYGHMDTNWWLPISYSVHGRKPG